MDCWGSHTLDLSNKTIQETLYTSLSSDSTQNDKYEHRTGISRTVGSKDSIHVYMIQEYTLYLYVNKNTNYIDKCENCYIMIPCLYCVK